MGTQAPTLSAIEYVCFNMREDDAREIYNMRPHNSAMVLAREVQQAIANKGRGAVITVGHGLPAIVCLVVEEWNGVWQVGMFGTDRFKEGVMEAVRWLRTNISELRTTGYGHLMMCDSRVDHTEAHKLIEALGAKQMCVMPYYGKDKSDYIRYYWCGEWKQPMQIGLAPDDNPQVQLGDG